MLSLKKFILLLSIFFCTINLIEGAKKKSYKK
jgi:hypothetical protein